MKKNLPLTRRASLADLSPKGPKGERSKCEED